MSGFIPDLANWALRGGAGENEENNDDSNNNNSSSNSSNNNRSNETLQPQLSEQEVRARRMARVEAMQRQLQESQQSPKEDPMQVVKGMSASTKQLFKGNGSEPTGTEASRRIMDIIAKAGKKK